MPSQIFIYIIAIILFAFILIYGYNAIREFTKKAEDVTYLKFVSSLENTIKQNSGYGDIEIKKFSISSDYEKICFVDLNDKSTFTIKEEDTCLCKRAAGCPPEDFDPVICDGWKDRKQNVFLVPPAPTPITVWNATVDGNDDGKEDTGTSCAGTNCFYLCLPIANGKLDLRLEGKGNRVVISKAPAD